MLAAIRSATSPDGGVALLARLLHLCELHHTLGYGDVTPVKRWNLLGPMTAMNGVLLFGWSTAVIFEVLRMTLLAGDEGDLQKREWPK